MGVAGTRSGLRRARNRRHCPGRVVMVAWSGGSPPALEDDAAWSAARDANLGRWRLRLRVYPHARPRAPPDVCAPRLTYARPVSTGPMIRTARTDMPDAPLS